MTSSTVVKKLHDQRRHLATSSPPLSRRPSPDLPGHKRQRRKYQIRFQWTSTPLERSTTHQTYAAVQETRTLGSRLRPPIRHPVHATGRKRGMAAELSVTSRRRRGGGEGK